MHYRAILLVENKIKVHNQTGTYSCSPGPFTDLKKPLSAAQEQQKDASEVALILLSTKRVDL